MNTNAIQAKICATVFNHLIAIPYPDQLSKWCLRFVLHLHINLPNGFVGTDLGPDHICYRLLLRSSLG